MLSSYRNPAPKRGPSSVATSPAFPGHRIGRADGPDRASLGLFAKKPLNFSRINPQSRPPLSFFFKKALELYRNHGPTFARSPRPCLLPAYRRRPLLSPSMVSNVHILPNGHFRLGFRVVRPSPSRSQTQPAAKTPAAKHQVVDLRASARRRWRRERASLAAGRWSSPTPPPPPPPSPTRPASPDPRPTR